MIKRVRANIELESIYARAGIVLDNEAFGVSSIDFAIPHSFLRKSGKRRSGVSHLIGHFDIMRLAEHSPPQWCRHKGGCLTELGGAIARVNVNNAV